MASKGITIAASTLALRILTLSALVACVVVFIINSVSVKVVIEDLTINNEPTKITVRDFIAYRFVISTAIIGTAYTILQLPFALNYACTGKRMMRNECLPEFDFYGDKVISFLLATGAGAGFAVSFELKSILKDLFTAIEDPTIPEIQESKASYNRFLNRGIIATAVLSLGFLCTAIISVLSSINRSGRKGFFN
ncbi:hypothetical protein P3X46_032114 [Hevea brasiliensis]|uniref:CASP-like protein n=1 Tax=Hevea brasiliensis TaxID=3981 RepID=A0ABQ9KPG4_HEVBR|nr:CASP-like protein 4D1 [Hevea brasiliensis]KAJ9141602.1 hypothetical protein P3X46_032114 [Hevea brasiliensis]